MPDEVTPQQIEDFQKEVRGLSSSFLLEGLGQIATISAGTLAVLVTFRGSLVAGSPHTWVLRVSWGGFALAVLAAVCCKMVASDAFAGAADDDVHPNSVSRGLAICEFLSRASLISFVVAVLALAAFGFANL